MVYAARILMYSQTKGVYWYNDAQKNGISFVLVVVEEKKPNSLAWSL